MKLKHIAQDEISGTVLANTLRKKGKRQKPKSKRKKKDCGCDD